MLQQPEQKRAEPQCATARIVQIKGKKRTAKKEPFIPDMRSEMDAEGWYTGTPGDGCFGSLPVQDADDL